MAKGAQAGSAWDELLELTAVVTGKALMPENQTRR
jgi:hypothetical protein